AVAGVITSVNQINNIKLTNVQTTGNTATATVSVTVQASVNNGTAQLANENGKWCWKDVGDSTGPSRGSSSTTPSSRSSRSSSSSSGSSGGGTLGSGGGATITSFLSKVNSGDSSGAMALVCPNNVSDIQPNVTKAAVSG